MVLENSISIMRVCDKCFHMTKLNKKKQTEATMYLHGITNQWIPNDNKAGFTLPHFLSRSITEIKQQNYENSNKLIMIGEIQILKKKREVFWHEFKLTIDRWTQKTSICFSIALTTPPTNQTSIQLCISWPLAQTRDEYIGNILNFPQPPQNKMKKTCFRIELGRLSLDNLFTFVMPALNNRWRMIREDVTFMHIINRLNFKIQEKKLFFELLTTFTT